MGVGVPTVRTNWSRLPSWLVTELEMELELEMEFEIERLWIREIWRASDCIQSLSRKIRGLKNAMIMVVGVRGGSCFTFFIKF